MSGVGLPRIPSRFEGVTKQAGDDVDLRALIVRVDRGLDFIQDAYDDMQSSGIGAFRVLRGRPGCGKSTLLGTLPLFLQDVETVRVSFEERIDAALEDLPPATTSLRVIVIDGRESVARISSTEVEHALHSINSFIRSDAGRSTLVVWPCNVDPLAEQIVGSGMRIGGQALLGPGAGVFDYEGPPQAQYAAIAEKTIASLNAGASLLDLGISADRAAELVERADTIGTYLELLRQDAKTNFQAVKRRLPDQESFSVWIVVIAGNEPEGDVAALTRGTLSHADIDRLMSATEANVVRELKSQPERLGVLATMLEARIVHLPILAAMDAIRDHAPDELRKRLGELTFKAAPTGEACQRMAESELGRALTGERRGTKKRGARVGDNTVASFEKLARFAANDDAALNRALGETLQAAGLVQGFEAEVSLSGAIELVSDLVVEVSRGAKVRLEVMWRKKTSRAEIANYTLTKLYAYGRAIRYLE